MQHLLRADQRFGPIQDGGAARWCRIGFIGAALAAAFSEPAHRRQRTDPVPRDWPCPFQAASRAASRSSWVCCRQQMTPAVASAMMLMTTSSSAA